VPEAGDIAAFGSAAEIGRQRVQLLRLAGIPLSLRRLSIGLEVCRDLLRYLRVFGWVGLKLLERGDQLPQRRKLTAIRLLRGTRADGTDCSGRRTGWPDSLYSGLGLFENYRRNGVERG